METSNQPFAACTEIEAIGVGAGAGTLGSTPARWLVAFTADTMRVSVSYKYGSRALSGASCATVSMKCFLGCGATISRRLLEQFLEILDAQISVAQARRSSTWNRIASLIFSTA